MTQTYYTKDADGEYFVAQPQPTLREMEPEDIDDTMSVAERAVRIVLAKAKGVCLSYKVHAIDHAGNSYLREASATQCANAIGALNIQPLIDQVHGILSIPTPAEPPADLVRDAALYCAVQRSCAELPEGWEIRIELERSAGTVSLVNPDGEDVDYPSDHEYMASDINDAIDSAIAAEKGGAK